MPHCNLCYLSTKILFYILDDLWVSFLSERLYEEQSIMFQTRDLMVFKIPGYSPNHLAISHLHGVTIESKATSEQICELQGQTTE